MKRLNVRYRALPLLAPRLAYRAHAKAHNRFVRKNGELGIITAGPASHILCALTVIAVTAATIANTIFAHTTR